MSKYITIPSTNFKVEWGAFSATVNDLMRHGWDGEFVRNLYTRGVRVSLLHEKSRTLLRFNMSYEKYLEIRNDPISEECGLKPSVVAAAKDHFYPRMRLERDVINCAEDILHHLLKDKSAMNTALAIIADNTEDIRRGLWKEKPRDNIINIENYIKERINREPIAR